MAGTRLALLAVFLLTLLATVADICIKRAADSGRIGSPYLVVAALLLGGSSYGWFFVLRHINLATLGGIYALATVLLLAASGSLLFGERLTPVEIGTLIVALLSLGIFWRHL